jgi:hypothetical protein
LDTWTGLDRTEISTAGTERIGSGSWVAQVPVKVAPKGQVPTIEAISASRDLTTRTGVELEASDANASMLTSYIFACSSGCDLFTVLV